MQVRQPATTMPVTRLQIQTAAVLNSQIYHKRQIRLDWVSVQVAPFGTTYEKDVEESI